MLDKLRFKIAVTNWSCLPAPIWWLIASPLLAFALGGRLFKWPRGCSYAPWRLSFWHVGSGKDYR